MILAIPFFQFSVKTLSIPLIGDIPIDPWATLVCIGFVVGLEIARNRAIKLNLSVRDLVDGAVVTVVTGFLVAHVVAVVFYFPERLERDGIWAILRFWEGFASTGGWIGAVLGAWGFYKLYRKEWALRYADTITYGFPFGWFFGRMGCGVVHDHVGAITTFPLAMDFDHGIGPWVEGSRWVHGIRHELGLYEMMLMIPVCGLFYYWGKQDRVPGFFLAWFGLLYAPMRFGLDHLRNVDLGAQDARYLGLTPAQYAMVFMFVSAFIFLRYIQASTAFVPLLLDGSGHPADDDARAEHLSQLAKEEGSAPEEPEEESEPSSSTPLAEDISPTEHPPENTSSENVDS